MLAKLLLIAAVASALAACGPVPPSVLAPGDSAIAKRPPAAPATGAARLD